MKEQKREESSFCEGFSRSDASIVLPSSTPNTLHREIVKKYDKWLDDLFDESEGPTWEEETAAPSKERGTRVRHKRY